ncbi:hypothetical protein C8R42DRAFT_718603 [Lentinula raphanica]|nr:hypothetical protein C8R42DRAFT_718603 [Lentinula raphanica]
MSDPDPAQQRRHWVIEEDQHLIGILQEQKSAGFQTDNGGFHQDAFNAASLKLKSSNFSHTSTQCSVRFTTLKKEFKQLKEIREKSGFGWDATRNVATAGADVWEKLLQKKPKLGKWRKKSFPLYDDIEALLENQIATGSSAFHPGESDSRDNVKDNEDDDEEEDEDEDEDKNDPSLPQTPAPPHRSLAPTSSSESISVGSRKRVAATPDMNERPVKRVHGRKPTQSDAGYEVADALRDLARSAAGEAVDPSMQSPVRRRLAIQRIEQDRELSDDEMTEAFKLVRRDTSIGDTYLAISNVSRRTRFIQSELEAASSTFN